MAVRGNGVRIKVGCGVERDQSGVSELIGKGKLLRKRVVDLCTLRTRLFETGLRRALIRAYVE